MKKMMLMMLAVMMVLMNAAALADNAYNAYMTLPEDSGDQAKAAVLAKLPQAQIDYLQLDYDDRRMEWDVFYSVGGAIGVCEVDARSYSVLRMVEYGSLPEGALKPSEAIAALGEAKGNLVITDFDIDREGSRLRYEGEAELDGRFYEFEMSVDGQIIEWERD